MVLQVMSLSFTTSIRIELRGEAAPRRGNDNRHICSRHLLMRSVDGRRRVLIQTGMFDVADNADDCSPRADIDRRLQPEPLPDRVFIRPALTRHRFVDNPDGRGFLTRTRIKLSKAS